MAHAGDNIRSLLDRLESINTLQSDIRTLNEGTVTEIAKGSRLQTAPTAATSMRPIDRVRQRAAQSAATAASAAAPAAGAAQPAAAAASAAPSAATAANSATAAAPAAGATQSAAGAPASNGYVGAPILPKTVKTGALTLQQSQREMRQLAATMNGRIPDTSIGGLWTDPNAFLKAWQTYVNNNGGIEYELSEDPTMFNALKSIWMNMGGTELKESVSRLDETITHLYAQREYLIEQRIRREPIYEMTHSAARMLVEADISQEQIKRIFRLVAGGAQRGMNKASADAENVSNRSLVGKGADLTKAVHDKIKKAFDAVDKAIAKTSTMTTFNSKFESLQKQLLKAAGGEKGTVANLLNWYRELAHKSPYLQTGIYAVLVAAVGLATGGVLGPALVGILKVGDRLLQGDKLSSALLKGFTTGAVSFGIGKLADYIENPSGIPQPDPAAFDQADNFVPDEPSGSAPSTSSGSGTASSAASPSSATTSASANFTPNEPSGAAPADAPVRPIQRPSLNIAPTDSAATSAGNATTSAGDAATNAATSASGGDWYSQLSDQAKRWLGGADRTDPFILQRLVNAVPDAANVIPQELYNQAAKNAARAAMTAASGSSLEENRNPWIDYKRTARINELRENRGVKPTRNFYLLDDGRQYLFKIVTNEGVWDKIKSAAKKVAGTVKSSWHTMSNNITFEKLDLNWRRNYGQNPATAKSAPIQTVVEYLREMGVTDYLIQWALDKMKLGYNITQLQQAQNNQQAQDGQAAAGASYQNTVVGPNDDGYAPSGSRQAQGGQQAQQAQGGQQTQAAQKTPASIADANSLMTNYQQFTDSGKAISPVVRGMVGSILKTALQTVKEDIEQLQMESLIRKLI